VKGVLFNVVEEVVVEHLSLATWDHIVVAARVDGAYTSLGTYDDNELERIVAAAARLLNRSPDDVLRFVGTHAFARLAERVPELMATMDGWRTVLSDLDQVIHVEVKKLYPDAMVPTFEAVLDGDDMILGYRSARRMCALADGLAVGAGRWFGVDLVVTHTACVREGAPECHLRVSEAGHAG